MTKTIFFFIGIVLMLLIAVALLLAIIFYDYVPNNKIVPAKIQAYEMPNDIQEELKESVSGEQNIVVTRYIDNADLDAYESTNDYNKGKVNPFADYTEKTPSNITGNNTANNNTTNTVGSNNNETTSSGRNEVYINTPGKNY